MSWTESVRFIGPQDQEWPALLRDPAGADVAPSGLYVRGAGDLGELLQRAIVVVGAEAATVYAVTTAHRLATELSRAGWTVVTSGGAGVASAARTGALAARNPAVVLPLGGLALPQPQGFRRQYERVTWAGLLVSASNGHPNDQDRIARNRILAALGAAVVVIEPAGLAIDVAWQAYRRGRQVFAVPGPVAEDSGSVAAHQLIRDGIARLVRDARDVLIDLGAVR